MKYIKKISFVILLIFLSNCGYTPLLTKQNVDFYIGEISLDGNREVNSIILNHLKKYKIYKKDGSRYDLKIISKHNKKIANKDQKGNAKNYNIEIKIDVFFEENSENITNKTFVRTASIAVENKKINEKNLERKHLKDLSKYLSEDIIFYLKTN